MTLTNGGLLSTYEEVLKTIYLPAVQEQLNNATILMDLVDINTKDVSGKEAKINCHYGRTTGTGARGDGQGLPTAGYQKHKQATIGMKYNYGRVQFTGPTIAATRDERGAYASVIDNEMTGLVKDIAQETNRQMWGCGYGVVGRWHTTSSGTSYKLQKKYTGNTVGGDGFGSTFGAKYLEERGDAVPVVFTTSSSVVTVLTVDATDIAVTAITEGTDTDTITCTDPSVTEAGGTFYVRPASLTTCNASTAAGAQRLEMMGIRGIVTNQDLDEIICYDGTNTGFTVNDPFQGLDVSTYPWWKAQVFASDAGRYAAQRALTEKLMQKVFDRVEKKAGKNYGPSLVMTTQAIRREYVDLVQADRRWVNTGTLDAGWSYIEYNGIPLMVDPDDAIDGEIYFLTLKDLQMYQMSGWDWMSKDGSIFSRVSGYDAYEATLYRYAEMGCTRRNTQAVLCDIAYDN